MYKSTGLAVAAALLLSQTIAFADEVSSTSIETNNGNAAATSTVKAEVGAGGAKVSTQKNAVRANADGSVTTAKEKESHAVGFGGSAHTKESASTTINPDGTQSTVKEEKTSVNP